MRVYDAYGNLSTFTDRKGQLTQYTYDSLDRLTQIQYNDQSATSFTWDAGNRVTQIVNSTSGTITRTYDNLDRLKSEITPPGSISYTYDAASRRTSMMVQGQPTVSYCYDNTNKLTQITQGTCQTPQAPTVSFTYDSANRRASLTLPNGIVAAYGYDAASRVTSITYTQGSATVGNLTYTYDANGRRTSIGGGLAGVNLSAATTSSGVYNVNNQLTSWNGTTLSYDLNGNMINDGSRSYSWNARNQLTSIGATTFAYDGSLRRLQNGAGVSFVYDGLNPVQEIVGGSVRANLVTGGLDEYFGRTDSGGTSSFVTDALGSTLALTDSTGTVKTQYTYEPFGNTTSSGTSSTNAFEYAGRENDGSGLYYYRARYYSPVLQRFISEDPIDFGGGDVNLYGYVREGPTNLADPTGTRPRPLPECVKQALERYFPGLDFKSVQFDDELPWVTHFATIDVGAITWNNTIYYQSSQFSGSARGVASVGHELTHIMQQQGRLLPYALEYGFENAVNLLRYWNFYEAYRNTSSEFLASFVEDYIRLDLARRYPSRDVCPGAFQ